MSDRSVAYLVKGWPRRSELFIASEIRRLEQLGVRIRLYVVKPADEVAVHEVVEQIAAEPVRLPRVGSLSDVTVRRWLRENLGAFRPALGRVARRHPLRLARVAGRALREAVRARRGRSLRRIYLKELLLAIALADEIERAGDVDHLHAHFAHGATTIAWFAATLLDLPFSFTGHAKDIYRESLNPAGLLTRKIDAAAFTVTCTGANVEHLTGLTPAGDVHLVYHGLNVEFTDLLAAAPPARPPDRPVVVSVGRFVAKKGFDVLVRAVAELRDRGTLVDLELIGESGDQDAAIHQLVADLGLGDVVTISGPATQPELLARYRQATCFALACRVDADGDRDGIPNVLVEAMASGLPVVSTTVSGIPELVRDHENGLLVAPEDPHALADALATLIAEPGLAARLAVAGAATVHDEFDGSLLAAKLAALFSGAPA